jgi:acyl-CoA thioesterase I
MIVRTLNTQRGVLLALVMAPLLCGCSEGSYAENEQTDQRKSKVSEEEVSSSIRILALGDSLTAGYGLDDLSLAFPARLEGELQAAGYDVEVLDAGISGDTTAGGRSRLDWSLADSPDAVIVGLGGNDGLRAVDPDVTYDNLNAIVERLTSEGLPVLLAGMQAPPNLGREYGDRFFGAYLRVADEYDVVFYPFLLDGVAGDPTLNQDDRIHPNPDGVNVMVEKILPFAERLIQRVQEARSRDTAS